MGSESYAAKPFASKNWTTSARGISANRPMLFAPLVVVDTRYQVTSHLSTCHLAPCYSVTSDPLYSPVLSTHASPGAPVKA